MRLVLLFLAIVVSLCSVPILSKENAKEAAPAKRIIALSPHSVEMLYAIGAGDRIIATLEFSDYPKQALNIPRIGNFTGIQIEKIIELQPDLIIGWKSGNKLADLKKIESLGFDIFYSHPKNIQEISTEIIKLGKRTGLESHAQSVALKIANEHQQIINRYKNRSKISVFYQLWHDPLRTVGPSNWNQSLISDCNGSNIFNDAKTPYPVISLENVLSKNPDVIIIPHHSGSEAVKKQIWSQWDNISAVKNNYLFTIDGDLLHRFGPRAIEGLSLLCEAIDSARD